MYLAAAVLASTQPADAEAGRVLAPHAVAGDGEEAPTLVVEPATVILGRTDVVNLRIEAPEREDDPPLRGSVNVGVLGEIEPVEPGVYEASYTPPEERFPQVAVIALWRETGPDATVAFFRLPLLGTARVPVHTVPGAGVAVSVGGRHFGPFEADEQGRAEARLVVPPGPRHAMVSAASGEGEATSQRIDLGIPPYNRLTLATVPHAITADGFSQARLHLYYDVTGRRPPAAGEFHVETALEVQSPLEHVEGPLYRAEYTAAPGIPDGKVELRASVRRDAKSSGVATVTVGRQEVAMLLAEASSVSALGDGVSPVELTLLARDRLGLGVGEAELAQRVERGELLQSVEIEEIGAGEYRARILPARLDPPREKEQVTVTFATAEADVAVAFTIEPWEPAEVLVEPEASALSADGSSTTTFELRAKDSDGRPMDHIQPHVSASSGTVVSVTAAEDGGYVVEYQAPLWRHRGRRGDADAPPPSREETLRVSVGGVTVATAIELAALVREPLELAPYLRAAGGLQTNLGALAGPGLLVHGGLTLGRRGPLSFGAGLWTGVSGARATWELGDEAAGARLFAVPLLPAGSVTFVHQEWSAGVGAGAGLMLAPGSVRLAGADDVPIGSVLPAFGAKLHIGRRAGPGRALVSLSYVHAGRRHHRGAVDVTGRVGGFGAMAGYGVDL